MTPAAFRALMLFREAEGPSEILEKRAFDYSRAAGWAPSRGSFNAVDPNSRGYGGGYGNEGEGEGGSGQDDMGDHVPAGQPGATPEEAAAPEESWSQTMANSMTPFRTDESLNKNIENVGGRAQQMRADWSAPGMVLGAGKELLEGNPLTAAASVAAIPGLSAVGGAISGGYKGRQAVQGVGVARGAGQGFAQGWRTGTSMLNPLKWGQSFTNPGVLGRGLNMLSVGSGGYKVFNGERLDGSDQLGLGMSMAAGMTNPVTAMGAAAVYGGDQGNKAMDYIMDQRKDPNEREGALGSIGKGMESAWKSDKWYEKYNPLTYATRAAGGLGTHVGQSIVDSQGPAENQGAVSDAERDAFKQRRAARRGQQQPKAPDASGSTAGGTQ